MNMIMIRNHRVWVTVFGLILAVGAAHGQNTELIDQFYDTTPLERAEAQAEVLVDVLELDPRQAGELVPIILKYSKKIQRLIRQGASDAVMYHEIQKFSDAKDEEIVALLTKEQVVRYQDYKAKLRRIVADVIQRRNK
jgi:hypothetical protein